MLALLSIALAGAAGTLARHGVSVLALRAGATFPLGTLAVNVAGSFLLGLLLRAGLGAVPEGTLAATGRLSLTVGFCGGFTTFSTFSADTALLLESGAYGRAATYVVASVALSLAAMLAGLAVGKLLR